MSEAPEELEKKIKTWLIEEYPTLEIESIPHPSIYFHLQIRQKEAGSAASPTSIALTKDNPDRLFIYFYWQLHEMQVNSINGLKSDVKKRFQKELSSGFLLMNLNLIPQPSIENIQKIKAEDFVILDGLTKHSLIRSVIKINCAHGYILSLFDLIMDQGFDPYRKL